MECLELEQKQKNSVNVAKDKAMNRLCCLGEAGKLLFSQLMLAHENIKIVCDITQIERKTLLAMRDRYIDQYNFDDLQQCAQANFWQLLIEHSAKGYSIVLKTMNKTHTIKDYWNSDQAEVERALLKNKVIISKYHYCNHLPVEDESELRY